MSEQKPVKELSLEELERLLESKRRAQLLQRADEQNKAPSRPAEDKIERAEHPVSVRRYRSWRPPSQPGQFPTERIAATEPQPRFRSLAMSRLSAAPVGQQVQNRGRIGKGRRLGNQLLLLVEVSAVLGLVALIITGISQLKSLNEQTAEALEAKIPTPQAVQVLPGSSLPPTPADLPSIYQRLVRRVTPIVLPTPGPHSPTRIVIKKIKVDAPIVPGDNWEELKKGVGHHLGSANPGMRGNMVLVAHDDIFGEIFRYLGNLEPGDIVTVYAGERSYDYTVKGKRIVQPTEVSVMDQTHEPMATLITCYPYGIDTHRIVVFAELAP